MKAVRNVVLIAFHMAFGALVGGILGPFFLVPKATKPDECGNGVVVGAIVAGAMLGVVVFGIVGCIDVDTLNAKSAYASAG